MNAPNPDTRSIGQVLYESMFPAGDARTLWVNLRPIQREPYERAAEVIFNRGFRSGEETQKKAAPPPRAKELLTQLVELANAAREYRDTRTADNVGQRQRAGERLEKALEGVP